MGYVAGGLIAGLAADAIDYSGPIAIVAGLSAASGIWVAFDMPARRSDKRPVVSADERAGAERNPRF